MAFWGVELKPGKPFTHYCGKSEGRLRISQATIGVVVGVDGAPGAKSVVQCNLGNRSQVFLCVLLPNKSESCHLDLEFEEADDVVFSVMGPQSVYLTGYYLQKNHQSNPYSDTESYGVDIENTQTEGSSYCSDDDKYDDSFIDDVDLPVTDPLISKDTPKDKFFCDKLRKRKKIVCSDGDTLHENEDGDGYTLPENEDGDGYILSALKNDGAGEMTASDDAENIANLLIELAGKKNPVVHCGSHLKEELDPNIVCKSESYEQELKAKMSSDDIETPVENGNYALIQGGQTFEIDVNNEISVINDEADGNKEATIFKQITSLSNGKDCAQLIDQFTSKTKRKKKKYLKRKDKTCEALEIDGDQSILIEDQAPEVKASSNMDVCSLLEAGSVRSQNLERRKEYQLEESCTGKIGGESHNIPKSYECKQHSLCSGSTSKDFLSPSAKDCGQQIDNPPEKKIHKKMKYRGNGDLVVGAQNRIDNLENTTTNYDEQNETDGHIKKRALSKGLIIEEMSHGPPGGKIAAVGKKIKVCYTAVLKESGRVFDSNVGSHACRCLLGDEKFPDGWNIGIEGMRVGDKRRLTIPPSLGFGSQGIEEVVPPNAWLVYEIELIHVQK